MENEKWYYIQSVEILNGKLLTLGTGVHKFNSLCSLSENCRKTGQVSVNDIIDSSCSWRFFWGGASKCF